jgi:hypothetical protein
MAIEQLAARCWVIEPADDTEGVPHYDTEQEAKATADHDFDPGEAATIRQLPTPCWTASCDGDCAATIDEEENYTYHYETRAEAESDAAAMGWTLTRDGDLFCVGDVPDLEFDDLAVLEQIPGQLSIDDLHGTGDNEGNR